MIAGPKALSAAVALAAFAGSAQAESCSKSTEYILTNASELPQNPRVYRELFRNCLETLQMSNVQDAFVLMAGAIAVIPRRDTVPATAATLAQFCTRFPKGTLHFIGRKQRSKAATMAQAVRFSAARSTPCQKITGN